MVELLGTKGFDALVKYADEFGPLDPTDYMQIVCTDNTAFMESFRNFLRKNGWMNEGWFEWRKEPIYPDAVIKRRQGVT